MNAYVSKEELTLLPANQISYGEHYADARGQRRSVFGAIGQRISAYFERQRILGELNSLSDRELSDIGLARSELPRVVASTSPRFVR